MDGGSGGSGIETNDVLPLISTSHARMGALLLAALLPAAAPGAAPAGAGSGAGWITVNGDRQGTRWSSLTQINRGSVARLKPAWSFRTGDAAADGSTPIECTPLAVDGRLYLTTAATQVVALDGATGRELWRYNPYPAGRKGYRLVSGGVNRGVAWWSDGRPEGARRILLATPDGRLISLDAATGKPDAAFGRSGVVDLKEGLAEDLAALPYGCTAPPAVYGDLAILGFSNSEGPPPAPPGDVRAFNIRTGREAWRFHTIPLPGEFGSETWAPGSIERRPGCNNWSGASVDPESGLVFVATGSPGFDFYGGDRAGRNLFGNCVIALDAATGRRRWHFQIVRHDLWDYDNPCPPIVLDLPGAPQRAVAQVTKTGYCFLFDRDTGRSLFPLEERTVPASDVPGEKSWPAQIFPLKPPPFSDQAILGPDDLTNISPQAHAFARARLAKMRHGPIFTPTALGPTARLPGFLGGANWGGAAYSPESGLLYVSSNNVAREHELRPAAGDFPYSNSGYGRFSDEEGYPANKPPWGRLTAIDLRRGEFAWQQVLGEYPELTKRGIPPTGTEMLGGCIVTAGGLVFVAATKDAKMRAFDSATGRLLWSHSLPFAGYATPCTYEAAGRQYVAIAAAGGGKMATPAGDVYLVFALPPDA